MPDLRNYFLLQILKLLPIEFLSNFLCLLFYETIISKNKTQTKQRFKIVGFYNCLHLNFGKKIQIAKRNTINTYLSLSAATR